MSLKINNYLKDNIAIIIFSSLLILFIYAVRLFNYNIGIDTANYLFDAPYINSLWNYEEGRFGLSILEWLFEGINLRLNLFSTNLLACVFLIISCLLWLSVFKHYSNYKNIYAELAFCLFYLSSKVWVEIIYFTMMATEVMFAVFLSPICAYIMTEGIIRKNYRQLIGAVLLLILIISVHQPMVVLVFAGLLAVYILRSETADKRDLSMIILATAAGIAFYFVLNYFILRFFVKSELSVYVIRQLGGGIPFKKPR